MYEASKAMKNEPYTYKIKNPDLKYAKYNKEDGKYYDKFGNIQEKYITKTVEAATMFDISNNNNAMLCKEYRHVWVRTLHICR